MTVLHIWRSNFIPLRTPAVRRYLAGTGISMLGNWLQQTAQALRVYQLSGGSAAALGTVSFCTGLPPLLFSFFCRRSSTASPAWAALLMRCQQTTLTTGTGS
ncbi:hypothetical protein [Janthinobacterium agaricidamnosum]|uniref:Major facilitator superfamily MFS_1 domain protein n=1 Tax=Janthinobacterium agaricidamnosum NBRC 102515 = DSM 9628 TaxID=1349767 RepID=W0VAU2_9BURK|nr:hypothetical protein [Janthinobacterium agaricidamnosum]CDG84458.1 major facilitator superfamily MFS_1 domain protein [Janthinobacterium agaricidamnosum NBRC 102515 = DSM 9628]